MSRSNPPESRVSVDRINEVTGHRFLHNVPADRVHLCLETRRSLISFLSLMFGDHETNDDDDNFKPVSNKPACLQLVVAIFSVVQ